MIIDFEQTAEFLKNCRDTVIITHQSPDGDCIGAGFALRDILDTLGIRSKVICGDTFPERYSFITDVQDGAEDFEPQSVISVDVADKKLMGGYESVYGNKVGLCIDHHVSNTGYARKTLLNPDASAACEVIYELAVYMGVKMSRHCAECLYTGIITDSGCFRYSCTGWRTHEIAGEMMKNYPDIDFALINRKMFEEKSIERVRLECGAVSGMESFFDGKLNILTVTKEELHKDGVKPDDVEGLAPMSVQTEGSEVGILIKERDNGSYKCSFRSAYSVNVAEICAKFGGGGHEKAAGCTLKGNLDEVKTRLVGAVGEALGL